MEHHLTLDIDILFKEIIELLNLEVDIYYLGVGDYNNILKLLKDIKKSLEYFERNYA